MHLQKFKVQEHTIKEFTELCERLESALNDLPSSKQTNRGSFNKNKSVGTRNAVAITATRMMEKINSTVSCMERILPTTPTTVKTLNSKLRNAKGVVVATATTSATTRKKGYNSNKEEAHVFVQFTKNAMNKDTNKELKTSKSS